MGAILRNHNPSDGGISGIPCVFQRSSNRSRIENIVQRIYFTIPQKGRRQETG